MRRLHAQIKRAALAALASGALAPSPALAAGAHAFDPTARLSVPLPEPTIVAALPTTDEPLPCFFKPHTTHRWSFSQTLFGASERSGELRMQAQYTGPLYGHAAVDNELLKKLRGGMKIAGIDFSFTIKIEDLVNGIRVNPPVTIDIADLVNGIIDEVTQRTVVNPAALPEAPAPVIDPSLLAFIAELNPAAQITNPDPAPAPVAGNPLIGAAPIPALNPGAQASQGAGSQSSGGIPAGDFSGLLANHISEVVNAVQPAPNIPAAIGTPAAPTGPGQVLAPQGRLPTTVGTATEQVSSELAAQILADLAIVRHDTTEFLYSVSDGRLVFIIENEANGVSIERDIEMNIVIHDFQNTLGSPAASFAGSGVPQALQDSQILALP